VSGGDIPKVASALGSKVRLRILSIICTSGRADMDMLAREVGKSKANISTQVRILERAGLIRVGLISIPGELGARFNPPTCMGKLKRITD